MSEIDIREAHSVQVAGKCPCCGNLRLYLFDETGTAFAMAELPRDAYVAVVMDIISEGEVTIEDIDNINEHRLASATPMGHA